MAIDVVQLHTLPIISLQCIPGEEHVSDLAKGKGCMGLAEEDVGWDDINIPFSKVGAKQYQQMYNIREAKWQATQHDQEAVNSLICEELEFVSITLNDLPLKIQQCRKILITRQINTQPTKPTKHKRQTNMKQSNLLLISLIKAPLCLYIALQFHVGTAVHVLFGILINTTNALIAHIEHQAYRLWRVSKEGASLHNVFMVKILGIRIFIELVGASDVAKVVVLKLQLTRYHVSKMLLVLALACFVGSRGETFLLHDASRVIEWTAGDVAFLA